MQPQGFFIHDEVLKLKAYVLLSQLLATYEFEKLAYSFDSPDVVNELIGCGDQELQKNIMSLAALARTNDDVRGGLAAHFSAHPKGVGTLSIDDGAPEPLSPREACNKIIHNKTVKLAGELTSVHPLYADAYALNRITDDQEYRVPFLSICGQAQGKNGKKWEAKVNMVQWIFAVAFFGGF